MVMERTTAGGGGSEADLKARLDDLSTRRISPLDLMPQEDLREKLVDLVLNGQPRGADRETSMMFGLLRKSLVARTVDDTRVVVFGGGSGLSNIIGGDSRRAGWMRRPFNGLKEIFPLTRSVVCVTDDGGSTGELMKDLPLVALGDIRHVLLSSIQLEKLQKRYGLSVPAAIITADILARIFNYRFDRRPDNRQAILNGCGDDFQRLPPSLKDFLDLLIEQLFTDSRFAETLERPHCLGNLLLAASAYREIDSAYDNVALAERQDLLRNALLIGLNSLSLYLGAAEQAVLPCTSTPAQLRLIYTNGVQITGESKSSLARRGVPVDRVYVDFHDTPAVYDDIFKNIREADILILAPGSLYSSIIPIFSVPGLADCVRENKHALKVLVSNLWVQAGETDLSIADPERKFHVSDMIRAYERNIPGGTSGLFREVLCLSLRDVPASVLQRYAVEGKVPIYLDRDIVKKQGYLPLECGIFSKEAMAERGVIQHDPSILAQAIKTLYITGEIDPEQGQSDILAPDGAAAACLSGDVQCPVMPCLKYRKIEEILGEIEVKHAENGGCVLDADKIRTDIRDIIWKHQDIPLAHLHYVRGIRCIDLEEWRRDQRWDNVFSFFEPADRCIMIRRDQFDVPQRLELAFLIALGESLLGDYARDKAMKEVLLDGLRLGKVYHLKLRAEGERSCYFSSAELRRYLSLARMLPTDDPCLFTRLINGDEGFTPPGLFMGLMYAWYLDNRLASHIEYKMSAIKIRQSDLIPEQLKMVERRKKIIGFFREVVFSAVNRQGNNDQRKKNGYEHEDTRH
jgi:uncharacterized cofD-like protein